MGQTGVDGHAEQGPNGRAERAQADARRRHVFERGAGVVLSLYRLLKVSQLHSLDNRAVRLQLDQTRELVGGLAAAVDGPVQVLFTPSAVFINGQLMKGTRREYDAALELGGLLERMGFNEVTLDSTVGALDLEAWVRVVKESGSEGRRSDRLGRPADTIRLRRVKAARLFEDSTEFSEQEQIVRAYASAIVVMREVFDNLASGKYELPQQAKRIAQKLVTLSEGDAPAFLGVTAMRSGNHDAAGRAVNASILAVAMARQLSDDLTVLSRVAMSALMFGVAEPYVLGLDRMEATDARAMFSLSPDDRKRLPAATALVFTALGRLREVSKQRAVIGFEAHWLLESAELGAVYGGQRGATFASHLVAAAHRFNQLLTPDPARAEFYTPDEAVGQLRSEAGDPQSLAAAELLVGAIGIFPTGTCVQLSSGELGVVLSSPSHPSDYVHPRVRVLTNRGGQTMRRAVDVDLREDPRRHVAQVLNNPSPVSRELAAKLLRGEPPPPITDRGGHSSDAPISRPPSSSRPIPSSAPPQSSGPGQVRVSWSPPSVGPSPSSSSSSSAVDSGRALTGEDMTPVGGSAPPPSSRVDSPRPVSVAPRATLVPRGLAPVATGLLSRTPLAHLFVYLLDRDLTGTLVLEATHRGRGTSQAISFEEGAATKAHTQRKIAALSHVLVKHGMLSEHLLLQPRIAQAGNDGPRLESLLCELNLVGEDEIVMAREEQLARRVEHLFGLPSDAKFSFFGEVDLLDSRVGVIGARTHPLASLLAGVRGVLDDPEVAVAVERLGQHPLVIHSQADITGFDFQADEREVVDRIRQQPGSVSSLMDAVEEPGLAARVVYVLLLSRSLDLGPRNPSPARRKARRMSLRANGG